MKLSCLSHALFAGVLTLAATAFADNDLLELRVSPERDQVFKTDGAEVVFDVNLHGRDIVSERHTPINLALVLDHSGSMTGAKIEKARQAACIAIDHLQPTDTFSLVQFDDRVDVLIPAQPVEDKERLKEIVDHIRPGGSTALYAGVEEGARQLRKYFDEKNVNRIVLVSDGIANVGPSSPGELAEMGRDLREKGASVTTVGLGDDYNENVMVSIAEASGANYYYVKDAEKLPGVFETELGQVKNAVAQNLRIIIDVPEGVEPIEIIGMPGVHFQGRTATVQLGSFYASQRRDLLVRCRVKSPQGESAEIGRAHIVYAAPGDGKEREADGVASVQFTVQKDAADKSVNAPVATQVALSENVAARQRALDLQDSGKLQAAAAVLKDQAAADAKLAPILKNDKLATEAKALDSFAGQMDAVAPLSNEQRKAFHYENYNQANQKEQQ
jgi:Ca-activated chloride channel family protein